MEKERGIIIVGCIEHTDIGITALAKAIADRDMEKVCVLGHEVQEVIEITNQNDFNQDLILKTSLISKEYGHPNPATRNHKRKKR